MCCKRSLVCHIWKFFVLWIFSWGPLKSNRCICRYTCYSRTVLFKQTIPDSYSETLFDRMFVQVCLYFYCKCLWRCLKFVARKLTGRCELQRICYNTKPGASRTMKIGKYKIISIIIIPYRYGNFIFFNAYSICCLACKWTEVIYFNCFS